MLYEAYVHQNGSVIIKKIFMFDSGKIPKSSIDELSPFVTEYLGIEDCTSYEEAQKTFDKKVRK